MKFYEQERSKRTYRTFLGRFSLTKQVEYTGVKETFDAWMKDLVAEDKRRKTEEEKRKKEDKKWKRRYLR